MKTWLADREAYCPHCKAWLVPDGAWDIDPAIAAYDDESLEAILSGDTRRYRRVPDDERRWEVEHYPDVYSKHVFVSTLREKAATPG